MSEPGRPSSEGRQASNGPQASIEPQASNGPQASIEPQALAGLRVIDIATFVAGPFAAACLAEFGADVIKVERPGVGDDLRRLGTPSEAGDTYWWFNDCRNKRCVTLNLKDGRGKAIFERLIKDADVLVENFRPGTLERWGIGPGQLHAVNPGLVIARISAYGQHGPKSHLPGFARIAQAYAGLSHLTGQPDTPPLIAGSTTLADYLSGLYAAYGVMLALRARETGGATPGIGQVIDVGLHDGIFRFLDEIATVYGKTGFVRSRTGTETHTAVPHSHFPCRGDTWVAIACTNDRMFERLAAVIGKPELAGSGRFGQRADRLAARGEVNGIVSDWTRIRSREDVIAACAGGEVPCGPVNSIEDIFAEPQFWERDTLMRVANDRLGEIAMQGTLPRLSGTPGEVRHVGPRLAEHNAEVYAGELGLDEDELRTLADEGVI